MASEQKLHLKYWAGRGLMEVPRMLLALRGKYASNGDFIDGRYTTDKDHVDGKTQFDFADVSNSLTANLGRMPVLTHPGVGDVGQSAAINFYVASELGLMGANNFEAAFILMIQEHIKETNLAFRKNVPYGKPPETGALDAWFEGGALDKSPAPADSKRRSERNLRWYAARIDACLPDSAIETGCAVGSSPTLADVLLYNMFAEFLHDHEAASTVAQYKREPFASKARTNKVLAECAPKIKAVCAAVAANKNIATYLKNRGVQRF